MGINNHFCLRLDHSSSGLKNFTDLIQFTTSVHRVLSKKRIFMLFKRLEVHFWTYVEQNTIYSIFNFIPDFIYPYSGSVKQASSVHSKRSRSFSKVPGKLPKIGFGAYFFSSIIKYMYSESTKSRFWAGQASAMETSGELKFVLWTYFFDFWLPRNFQLKRIKYRGNWDP